MNLSLRYATRKQIEASQKQFRTFADSIQNLVLIATLEGMSGWENKVHPADHNEKVVAFVKDAWQKNEVFERTFPLCRHNTRLILPPPQWNCTMKLE